MATGTESFTNLKKLGWYLGHCNHGEWDKFRVQEQERMVEDDLAAGRNVSLILLSLISIGMILSAVTLLVVLAAS